MKGYAQVDNQLVDIMNFGTAMDPAEMSMWSLLLRADPIVQVVIGILIIASIWCWAVIIEKIVRLRRLKSQADAFEETFWSGGSLEDLYDRVSSRPEHPMELLFASAMREWRRSTSKGLAPDATLRAGIKERIGQVMSVTLGREMERLEKYLGLLATVGSTAPFIGLFGTVWGIMNSFQAIAVSKDTNLAVVAPGIAEALFATALGLIAAIPAVVAYNKLSQDLGRYGNRLSGFVGEFSAILSRQLEDKGA